MTSAKVSLDINRVIGLSKEKIRAFVKEVNLEVGQRLVKRSVVGNPALWSPPRWPKGYHPGTFINNWQLGVDQRPNGIINAYDATGQGSLSRLSKNAVWESGHKYYYTNNLPYAMMLEMGTHSKQVGPQGMVRITQIEFPQIVQTALGRVNKKGN